MNTPIFTELFKRDICWLHIFNAIFLMKISIKKKIYPEGITLPILVRLLATLNRTFGTLSAASLTRIIRVRMRIAFQPPWWWEESPWRSDRCPEPRTECSCRTDRSCDAGSSSPKQNDIFWQKECVQTLESCWILGRRFLLAQSPPNFWVSSLRMLVAASRIAYTENKRIEGSLFLWARVQKRLNLEKSDSVCLRFVLREFYATSI